MKPQKRVTQAQVQLSTDRPVRVQPLVVDRPVAPHDHDYHEISLLTAGECVHRTREKTETLAAGDVIVMPPGDVHAFERPRGLAVVNVYYLAEWLSTDPPLLWSEAGLVPLFCSQSLVKFPGFGAKTFTLDAAARRDAEQELIAMRHELDGASPGPAMLKGCFLKVLTLLARAWRAQDASADATRFRVEVWQTLGRIERCVGGGQPFALSKLADQVGLSVDHLSAEFRSAIGYSPVQYFQRRRVQRACQLLADRRLSITEVAQLLGYADAPHFCRLFKTHQGMSPRAYRETYAK